MGSLTQTHANRKKFVQMCVYTLFRPGFFLFAFKSRAFTAVQRNFCNDFSHMLLGNLRFWKYKSISWCFVFSRKQLAKRLNTHTQILTMFATSNDLHDDDGCTHTHTYIQHYNSIEMNSEAQASESMSLRKANGILIIEFIINTHIHSLAQWEAGRERERKRSSRRSGTRRWRRWASWFKANELIWYNLLMGPALSLSCAFSRACPFVRSLHFYHVHHDDNWNGIK